MLCIGVAGAALVASWPPGGIDVKRVVTFINETTHNHAAVFFGDDLPPGGEGGGVFNKLSVRMCLPHSLPMHPSHPRAGDLVWYAGYTLYYQPNGKWCYLYSHREDVGDRLRAVFTPAAAAVFPPPLGATTASHALPALKPARADVEEEVATVEGRIQRMVEAGDV